MPDASGYVERTETLALRKELGSGSDVTGSARCWNRVMVKCEILTKGLGLALVTLKLMAMFRDISITERVRFWVLCDGECKMLEQGYGEAWVTSMFQVKCEILTKGLGLALVTLKLMATFRDISITERVRFWVLCDGECKMLEQGYGECAIQFQDYSEAIVVSMVILEFQATGPR
ncbi:Notchless Protein 1 [Manis pentadactyla]|nr:Notchless Protein 1 [Manis pentadactyla]